MIHYIDADPANGLRFPILNDFGAHVVFASAIISAYSAIEELGFEVRASNQRPSFIGRKWNPVVQDDLERRLKAGRVDLDEAEVWMVRGRTRRIDRDQSHLTGPKARWARGEVRDVELNVEDAIARAAFLRSRVSSHRLGNRGAQLTVLDVLNVQLLARRLLLDTWELPGT